MVLNVKNNFAGTLIQNVQIINGKTINYSYFLPNKLPKQIEINHSLILKLEEANLNLGELKGLTKNIGNIKLFVSIYKRREAVLSSKIEGTRVSLTDIFLSEAGSKEKENYLDIKEVLNYIRALDFGLSELQKGKKIDVNLLNQMHYILLHKVRGSRNTVGEFRRVQNWIGRSNNIEDAEYIPPDSKHIDELMEFLFQFMNEENNVPKLIKIGLMHYFFESIHPYEDGNGRIGRTLILLYLNQLKIMDIPLLYLSPFFERNRDKYYDFLMKVREEWDYNSWLLYFLDGISEISIETAQKVKTLIELNNEYKRRLKNLNATSITYSLLDNFFENPYSTIPKLQKEHSKNYPLIKRGITYLLDAKILIEITRQKRNKFYVAPEILNIVEK